MRFIFIVLFLVSFGSVSMGGVGDVYFCSEERNYVAFADRKNYEIGETKLGNIKFKIKDSVVVFDGGGFEKSELIIDTHNPSNDYFKAYTQNLMNVIMFKPPH